MFPFSELKQVHIEITSRCQASCPMCSRNYHGGLENPNLQIADWTLEEFKQVFDNKLLTQLSSIYFCGNFGDPIINDDLIGMCQYVKDSAPHVSIRIHTNGSARSKKWWRDLAHSLPESHVVIFGLDGLEDTHHLYRTGTNFKNIIANATAFIQEGGVAEWVFIKFKHNEHQTTEAEDLAQMLGFKRFTVKNSIRFLTGDKFDVLDKNGNLLYQLEPPQANQVTFVDKNIINKVDDWLSTVEIDCYVHKTREVYMDAHKKLMPCCFLAATPYNYSAPDTLMAPLRTRALNEYNALVQDLGGEDAIDLSKKHAQEIIDSPEWQTVWNKYWKERRLLVCAKTCGKTEMSKPIDQIIGRKTINA